MSPGPSAVLIEDKKEDQQAAEKSSLLHPSQGPQAFLNEEDQQAAEKSSLLHPSEMWGERALREAGLYRVHILPGPLETIETPSFVTTGLLYAANAQNVLYTCGVIFMLLFKILVNFLLSYVSDYIQSDNVDTV